MPPLPSTFTRRQFLAAAAAPLACRVLARPAGAAVALRGDEDEAYSFVFLGDIHYAQRGHYGPEATGRNLAECIRTERMFTPLLDEIAAQIDQQHCRFVLQVGDWIHGHCPDPATSQRHVRDGLEAITAAKAKWRVPFFLARGNHELEGPGDRYYTAEMYRLFDERFMPYLRAETGRPEMQPYYSWRVGPDRFVVLDSSNIRTLFQTEAQLAWLERELEGHRAGGRNLFVMSHAPLLVENQMDTLFFDQPARRNALFTSFLRFERVTFLCGHTHHPHLLVYARDGRRILQLNEASLGDGSVPAPAPLAAKYRPEFILRTVTRSPELVAPLRHLVEADQPMISHYERGAFGYSILAVNGRAITITRYCGLGQRRYSTFEFA